MTVEDAAVADHNGQYLAFLLGEESFGVDILKVQEIRGWEPVRALPESPPCVKGVLDLRGTIVPILDLRVRLGNPSPSYGPTTVTIIVAVGGMETGRQLVGMVVDAVSGVIDAAMDEVKPAPSLAGGIGGRYLLGMVSGADGMTVLLDVDKVLGEAEWAQLQASGQ